MSSMASLLPTSVCLGEARWRDCHDGDGASAGADQQARLVEQRNPLGACFASASETTASPKWRKSTIVAILAAISLVVAAGLFGNVVSFRR
ncbi:hypothetical protein PC129_g2952 [Phytophthora cactorum]|uniref:Uncharacterized protein n=1 Tax=Phytophthora cactorum TaxID=29920 RepID=A0A8T1E738_9STRA|nr:hypothetical protein Pcac1_g19158 [Phytophthora cactorum]KAG2922505.1 hypothetical protein PC114_g5242 [Phytophthora cactorum]KAG2950244.1 hypothetical protein PC117_g4610 [Phytophthora cactorum]KAG3016743.1 hypothetical protein PC120_g11444 [Phytophthora cactorum]KAG3036114.1 hypothetical protein PC119_g4339 [Phytophthora cactorum]